MRPRSSCCARGRASLRVLLTGGVGYLGGRLAQWLATHSRCEIVLGTRSPEHAPEWTAAHRLVRTDWTQEAGLARACAGVDAVIHLAGMNARRSAADPVGALECSALGTARLLSAACQERVPRFVYLSSAHVYGSALAGCVDENTCPLPRHPYATSRRAAEDVVRQAQGAGRIAALVVRLSNAFGAPADPTADCWSLFTNDLCLQAVRTQRLVLRTTGQQRRDFVPLGEACRALEHLLAVPAEQFRQEIINVGGGWAPTLREMAALIAARVTAVLGLRPELHCGEVSDAIGNELIDYRIGRLLASGFVPDREAVVPELDRLIRFCQQHRESLP
jgi:UDP-glucose 4-epimerase